MSNEEKKSNKAWSRDAGYHECTVSVFGNRAKRVHYHDPEGFDNLLATKWKEFYDELCKMPDPAIPSKKDKIDGAN